jgi:hypothetical protein
VRRLPPLVGLWAGRKGKPAGRNTHGLRKASCLHNARPSGKGRTAHHKHTLPPDVCHRYIEAEPLCYRGKRVDFVPMPPNKVETIQRLTALFS